MPPQGAKAILSPSRGYSKTGPSGPGFLLYSLYSEKFRRLYAAAEALKLGYGGISYISRLLGCDRNTIIRGMLELNNPESIEEDRIRTTGGGRKTSLESIPDLDVNFLEVIFVYTAGDPMDEKIRWTHLTHEFSRHRNYL